MRIMSTEVLVWLFVCALTVTLCCGGIVYLQKTGRAGKYAWTRKDRKQSAGCLVQLALGLPFLAMVGILIQEFQPLFNGTNFWNSWIWLYLFLSIVCGVFNLIVRKLTRKVEQWIDSQKNG